MRSRKRVFYTGDVNAEHGGTFYSLRDMEHGYASAVRVQPCSNAGASWNCYWIESLTIVIPADAEALARILQSSDIELATFAEDVRPHVLVEACLNYGSYDIDSSECVQIGAKPSEHGEAIAADRMLRADADIGRYARKQMRGQS